MSWRYDMPACTPMRDAGTQQNAEWDEQSAAAPQQPADPHTDLTFVGTWAGVAYVCFIVDACSRAIVGWRVASHMRTSMVVLDAIEMARWSRGPGSRACVATATPAVHVVALQRTAR